MSRIETNVIIAFPENPKLKPIYPKLGKDGFHWQEGQAIVLPLKEMPSPTHESLKEMCDNSVYIWDVKVNSVNKSTTVISDKYGEVVLEGYMRTKNNNYVKAYITVKTHIVEEKLCFECKKSEIACTCKTIFGEDADMTNVRDNYW